MIHTLPFLSLSTMVCVVCFFPGPASSYELHAAITTVDTKYPIGHPKKAMVEKTANHVVEAYTKHKTCKRSIYFALFPLILLVRRNHQKTNGDRTAELEGRPGFEALQHKKKAETKQTDTYIKSKPPERIG